ncbi:DNA/RNA-binding protein kin17 [Entophlyctis luteolus]|nr:DNA/RNA-binding protein kin17 [Entophlyctis luteolus]
MCEKQCRDENGFKCHCASEAHQRQMALFAESSGKYVAGFSAGFKADFMKILSLSHGTKRVHANVVYQEYIQDKNHIHMNATCWNSLNGFVRTLASQGRIILEETEKGPFITWIDDRPETLARQEAIARKERMEKTEDERNAKLLQEQIERAKDATSVAEAEYTEFKKTEADEPLKLKLEFKVKSASSSTSASDSSAAGPSVDHTAKRDEDDKLEKPADTIKSTVQDMAKKPSAFSFGVGSSLSLSGGGAGSVLKRPAWMKADKIDKSETKNSIGAPNAAGANADGKKLSAMQRIMEEEKRKREWKERSGPAPKRLK